MKKSTSAIAVTAALLFSTAAFAQTGNNSTAPNMQTTPDGVTPTPDATNSASPSGTTKSKHVKHKKMHRADSKAKADSADNSKPLGSTTQTTPDGVTPTPDATVPAK